MLLAAIALLAAQTAPAQAVKCPRLAIESGRNAKQETFLKLTVDPAPKAALTFSWSTAGAAISEGQGTVAIVVDAPKGAEVTAAVEVGGLAPECGSVASTTLVIGR